MKQWLVFSIGLYLLLGFVFAVRAYSYDLRTFDCEDERAPHGTMMIGTRSYRNPDPTRCVRRGSQLVSIASIPFLTAFGVPILVVRALTGD